MSDANTPVTLISVTNEFAASAIVAALAAAGIKAETTGAFTSGFRAEVPGDVEVVVRQADVEAGMAVLEEIAADDTPVDWSQIDVGEPED